MLHLYRLYYYTPKLHLFRLYCYTPMLHVFKLYCDTLMLHPFRHYCHTPMLHLFRPCSNTLSHAFYDFIVAPLRSTFPNFITPPLCYSVCYTLCAGDTFHGSFMIFHDFCIIFQYLHTRKGTERTEKIGRRRKRGKLAKRRKEKYFPRLRRRSPCFSGMGGFWQVPVF